MKAASCGAREETVAIDVAVVRRQRLRAVIPVWHGLGLRRLQMGRLRHQAALEELDMRQCRLGRGQGFMKMHMDLGTIEKERMEGNAWCGS